MGDQFRALPEDMEGVDVDKFADPEVVNYGQMTDEDFKQRVIRLLTEDPDVIRIFTQNH
jgi:hypothetical protein